MAETLTKSDQEAIESMNETGFDGEPGQSLEEQNENKQDEQPPTIQGTKAPRQLSLLAGGEKPDSSSFKMQGGKVNVEGEFEKGQTVDLLVKVRVGEVHFVDQVDKDGYVVGTDRRHIAKPLSIQRYVAPEDTPAES